MTEVMHVTEERLKELVIDNAELKAHIERLKEAIPDVLEQFERDLLGWKKPNFEWFSEIFNETPSQSLNHIIADGIQQMLSDMEDLHYDPAMIVIQDILEYVRKLRTSDEKGN